MKDNLCKWCGNEILETEGLLNIRESLSIPIIDPEPIDKMVIDGTCCLDCFNRHSSFGKDLVGMRYCVKCGDPLYPPIANVIWLLNNRLKAGKLTEEDHSERVARFSYELSVERERRSRWPVFDEWDQAFRDEILCAECTATGRNRYSISTEDVQREVAHV